MKIDWKAKNTKIVLVIVLVIIVPIIFNKTKSSITGIITNYMMSQPKTVEVAHPIEREVLPTQETTGRIEANISVDVIARVEGWLQQRYFEEGDIVRKGQRLFLIQPDEYQLAVRNASATVREARAVYKNSVIDYNRAYALLKEDLVSREYFDDALMNRNKNRAALDGAAAQLSKASLDLSYTNVTSPMDGRIGQVKIKEGNYVTPGSGPITQIYTIDPIKVIFPLKSADFIQLKKLYYEKKAVHAENSHNPVSIILKLSDNTTYESEGKVEFVDNKIDESTGTVTVKALFRNPQELLVPGDYVNVVLRKNTPEKVMMIPQSATKTNIGTGYYVWVEKDGKAIKKDIKVNHNIDNNWIVESGLEYSDNVIVKGIQDIYQTGQKVKVVKSTTIAQTNTEPEKVDAVSTVPVKQKTSLKHKVKNEVKRVIKKIKH